GETLVLHREHLPRQTLRARSPRATPSEFRVRTLFGRPDAGPPRMGSDGRPPELNGRSLGSANGQTPRRLERTVSPIAPDPPSAGADAPARLSREVEGRVKSGAPGWHGAGRALLPDWIPWGCDPTPSRTRPGNP